MVIPTVLRNTESFLRDVPRALREGSFALGANKWRMIATVVLPAASRGILTGVLLALARVAGETAPLLFTAFGNQYWNWRLDQPTAALPLQIFTYAISPYDDWHRQAWAGALVLIVLIVSAVAAVRFVVRRGTLGGVV
jgi:phosphate transport system permease protein